MNLIGSLQQKMGELIAANASMVVLVVDQQGAAAAAFQNAQIAVLATARAAHVPVWFVLFNPTLGGAHPAPTPPMDPNLGAPDATYVKRTLAVFNPGTLPNLRVALEGAGIEWIVIMGRQSGQCVRLAAVGGPIDLAATQYATGATSMGYKILTCPQIQSVAHVAWANESKVWCYDQP